MVVFSSRQWKVFRRIRKKYPVPIGHLQSHRKQIRNFILYAMTPKVIIKRYCLRTHSTNQIILHYYRLRTFLFDLRYKKMIKRRKQNFKLWSRGIVNYLRKHGGIKEYEEEYTIDSSPKIDVSEKMKEQLELLKSGKREVPWIPINQKALDGETNKNDHNNDVDDTGDDDVLSKSILDKDNKEALNDNKLLQIANKDIGKPCDKEEIDETNEINSENALSLKEEEFISIGKTENQSNVSSSPSNQNEKKSSVASLKKPGNFLDMLINKVGAKRFSHDDDIPSTSFSNKSKSFSSLLTASHSNDNNKKLVKSLESGKKVSASMTSLEELSDDVGNRVGGGDPSLTCEDDFLGFDDSDHLPGMLQTPLVPINSVSKGKNSAFESDTLNDYLKKHKLSSMDVFNDCDIKQGRGGSLQNDNEGLITTNTKPPPMDMPAVPESLQRLRTVAERKTYLQKCSKSFKLAIINNEVTIYKELQRKMRFQKSKTTSQILMQAPTSKVPFTRIGWHASSFLSTDFNKYYMQKLDIDNGEELIKLIGVRGNNEKGHKTPFLSKHPNAKDCAKCSPSCPDLKNFQQLKFIKVSHRKNFLKLNNTPLCSVFKACPLSKKIQQKPRDEDAAAMLLAGGSMAVVRMPTVEIEVFPEKGKPLHEVAKRYLQYILPYQDITREWAEFSVSTLLEPSSSSKDKGDATAATTATTAAANTPNKKSFCFAIPYSNDENNVLVRRVVDRSETLDPVFTKNFYLSSAKSREQEDQFFKDSLKDLTFRQNIDSNDPIAVDCADALTDMINATAISCCENSFIKNDPDNDYNYKSDDDLNEFVKNKKKGNQIPKTDKKIMPSQQTKGSRDQKRFLMELKRLNCSVISTNSKLEDLPCSNGYCRLGCVCSSLRDGTTMRQHCGKADCMLDCTCKTINQSHIQRLDADGSSITTEDAYILRRKATERLARMEKEFTSTIVLTENETLLINESQYDKKRRCTKLPKRYDDYADTDDERTPKKSSSSSFTNTAATSISPTSSTLLSLKENTSYGSMEAIPTELKEPIYVDEKVYDSLKHCSVVLNPFLEIDNMVTFCMVHQLYKCFCNAEALEGKPMIIDRELPTAAKIQNEAGTLASLPNTKAYYSFEKEEENLEHFNNKKSKRNKKKPIVGVIETKALDVMDENNGKRASLSAEIPMDSKSIETLMMMEEGNESSNDVLMEIRRKRGRPPKSCNKSKKDETLNENDNDDYNHQAEVEFVSVGSSSAEAKKASISLAENQKLKTLDMDLDMDKEKEKPKINSVETIINSYLSLNPNFCRRIIPIPTSTYKAINRQRRRNVLERACRDESPHKSSLLVEHVLRCAQFHKNNTSMKKAKLAKRQEAKASAVMAISSSCSDIVMPFMLKEEQDQDSEQDQDKDQVNKGYETPLSTNENSLDAHILQTALTNNQDNDDECLPRKRKSPNDDMITPPPTLQKKSKLDDHLSESSESSAEVVAATSSSGKPLSLPKITSCISLNHENNQNNNKPSSSSSTAKATSTSSLEILEMKKLNDKKSSVSLGGNFDSHLLNSSNNSKNDDEKSKDETLPNVSQEISENFHKSVIRHLNGMVNKKMQDIDNTLKRESTTIPLPHGENLCIIRWESFLQGFMKKNIYVWQVTTTMAHFYAATVNNIMPMCMGALGVVNVIGLKGAKNLPFFADMFLKRLSNETTKKLALVLQSRNNFWIIKGFLLCNDNLACSKPTPQTHPSLAKKINVLYSSMAAQKIKEMQTSTAATTGTSTTATATLTTATATLTTATATLTTATGTLTTATGTSTTATGTSTTATGTLTTSTGTPTVATGTSETSVSEKPSASTSLGETKLLNSSSTMNQQQHQLQVQQDDKKSTILLNAIKISTTPSTSISTSIPTTSSTSTTSLTTTTSLSSSTSTTSSISNSTICSTSTKDWALKSYRDFLEPSHLSEQTRSKLPTSPFLKGDILKPDLLPKSSATFSLANLGRSSSTMANKELLMQKPTISSRRYKRPINDSSPHLTALLQSPSNLNTDSSFNTNNNINNNNNNVNDNIDNINDIDNNISDDNIDSNNIDNNKINYNNVNINRNNSNININRSGNSNNINIHNNSTNTSSTNNNNNHNINHNNINNNNIINNNIGNNKNTSSTSTTSSSSNVGISKSNNKFMITNKLRHRSDYDILNTKLLKDLAKVKNKTNIKSRQMLRKDIENLDTPDICKVDHRWLVLDIQKDFSHIFVSEYNDLISLDRIQNLMTFCKQQNRTVKLQFSKNANFDAYVLPKSSQKLYFGPLKLNVRPPSLLLLQSVDGKMMLRETYERLHNVTNKNCTTAFWIIIKKGIRQFGVDCFIEDNNANNDTSIIINNNNINKNNSNNAVATSTSTAAVGGNLYRNETKDNDSDSDDCAIIEEEEEEEEGEGESESKKLKIDNDLNKSLDKRLNFIIQTASNNPGKLEIKFSANSHQDKKSRNNLLPSIINPDKAILKQDIEKSPTNKNKDEDNGNENGNGNGNGNSYTNTNTKRNGSGKIIQEDEIETEDKNQDKSKNGDADIDRVGFIYKNDDNILNKKLKIDSKLAKDHCILRQALESNNSIKINTLKSTTNHLINQKLSSSSSSINKFKDNKNYRSIDIDQDDDNNSSSSFADKLKETLDNFSWDFKGTTIKKIDNSSNNNHNKNDLKKFTLKSNEKNININHKNLHHNDNDKVGNHTHNNDDEDEDDYNTESNINNSKNLSIGSIVSLASKEIQYSKISINEPSSNDNDLILNPTIRQNDFSLLDDTYNNPNDNEEYEDNNSLFIDITDDKFKSKTIYPKKVCPITFKVNQNKMTSSSLPPSLSSSPSSSPSLNTTATTTTVPSASIIKNIKIIGSSSSSTRTSTSLSPSISSLGRSLVKTTANTLDSSNTNDCKLIIQNTPLRTGSTNSHGLQLKRTANGIIKTITTTQSIKLNTPQTKVISPMSLGPSRNFSSVRGTPYTFNKNNMNSNSKPSSSSSPLAKPSLSSLFSSSKPIDNRTIITSTNAKPIIVDQNPNKEKQTPTSSISTPTPSSSSSSIKANLRTLPGSSSSSSSSAPSPLPLPALVPISSKAGGVIVLPSTNNSLIGTPTTGKGTNKMLTIYPKSEAKKIKITNVTSINNQNTNSLSTTKITHTDTSTSNKAKSTFSVVPKITKLLSNSSTSNSDIATSISSSPSPSSSASSSSLASAGLIIPNIKIHSAVRQSDRRSIPGLPTKSKTKILSNSLNSSLPIMKTISPSPSSSPSSSSLNINNNSFTKSSKISITTATTTTSTMKPNNTSNADNTSSLSQNSSKGFGYFCASTFGIPRFVAKRNGSTFLVKLPNMAKKTTYMKVSSENASSYLNEHVALTCPELSSKLPTTWKFIYQRQNKDQILEKATTEKTSMNAGNRMNEVHKSETETAALNSMDVDSILIE